MKKTLFFLAAALTFGLAANAQTPAFSENFNNVANGAIPSGWTTYGDGLPNINSSQANYSSFNDSWQAYNGSMLSISWTQEATACDRWLVTPQITVPTTNPILTFVADGTADPNEYPQYAEYMKIMISTTDNQKNSFTLLRDLQALPEGSNTYAVDLSAYAGQAVHLAFVNYGDGMYIFMDDVVVDEYPNNRVGFVSSNASWLIAAGSNSSVEVTAVNTGRDTLTSFDIVYSVNGGESQTISVSDIAIPLFGTYTKTFTYSQETAGAATFNITVNNPNGDSEAELNNNSGNAITTFYTADQTTQRNTVLEHFTTARCPNCPSAHQRLEQAINNIEDRVIWIAHHSGYYTDAMTIAASEEAQKFFNDGGATYAPAIMLDRSTDYATSEDPGPVFFPGNGLSSIFSSALSKPALVTVNISNVNYNPQSRTLSLTVSGQFISDVAFDSPRLTVYLMQDNILAAQSGATGTYVHNHVLRACVTDAWGDATAITSTTAGSTFEKTYTFTLPTNMRADFTWAAAFVSNDNSNVNRCQIHNGAKTGYLMTETDPTSGIADVEASINVVTYPNPATKMAYVTAEGPIRSYEMVDAMGRKVMSQQNVNADILELNVESLSAGVYFISVTTDKGVATQRLSVVK